MAADHWIGPHLAPAEYLVSNQGLYVLDKAGVLVTLYRDRHDQSGPRKEYNPAFIANYAIAACRTFVATQDKASLTTARKQLDWLLSNAQLLRRGDITAAMYPYTFDWVKFQLKAPWVSAFAQSLVGVAFSCGADATGSDAYLKGARLAFNALRIPMSDGGVTTFERDSAWFEEAARAGFPSTKILNGHLTAAEGLRNFLDWHPDATYEALWRQHLRAVERNLPLYDSGFLSYYAQYPVDWPHEWEPSGRIGYNAIHVIQLSRLYQQSGMPIFLKYALRFSEYETPNLRITAAGSTVPETNGPDRINMVMGNDYWSHAVLPTWVQVDMGGVFDVRGLHFVAHTAASAPKSYLIELSRDGRNYLRILERTDNRNVTVTERWRAVRARYLRLIIRSDNGNGNVTLKGIYPIRRQRYGAAAASPTAISVSNMPSLALQEQGWRAPKQGWLAFRRDALPALGIKRVRFVGTRSGSVTVSSGRTEEHFGDARQVPLTCEAGACSVDVSGEDQVVLIRWQVEPAGPNAIRMQLR